MTGASSTVMRYLFPPGTENGYGPEIGGHRIPLLLVERIGRLALPARRGRVRTVAGLILHHVGAAVLHVVHQARLIGANVGAHIVGAHARHDRVEALQVSLLQIALAEQRDVQPELAQRLRHRVARAHDVAHLLRRHLDIGAHQLDLRRREQRLRREVRILDHLHARRDVAAATLATASSLAVVSAAGRRHLKRQHVRLARRRESRNSARPATPSSRPALPAADRPWRWPHSPAPKPAPCAPTYPGTTPPAPADSRPPPAPLRTDAPARRWRGPHSGGAPGAPVRSAPRPPSAARACAPPPECRAARSASGRRPGRRRPWAASPASTAACTPGWPGPSDSTGSPRSGCSPATPAWLARPGSRSPRCARFPASPWRSNG